jgi:opacity protein-like surface antigen
MMAPRPKADVQGSIRGKLGIAWDRVMIYGTGGVAFGGFNTNFSLASAGGVTAAGHCRPPLLRQRQLFDHSHGLDGGRRPPICHYQQLVGIW